MSLRSLTRQPTVASRLANFHDVKGSWLTGTCIDQVGMNVLRFSEPWLVAR
jgi:hypothetical protein